MKFNKFVLVQVPNYQNINQNIYLNFLRITKVVRNLLIGIKNSNQYFINHIPIFLI